MRIAVGSDHGGFLLKEVLREFMKGKGHEVIDVGTCSPEPADYPVYARAVASSILKGTADRGVLICGSGVGASVAANKFSGIRASVCHDTFSSRQGVEDDAMNVLCLGARVIGSGLAKEIVLSFLSAQFSGIQRHQRRLDMIKKIEEEFHGG